MNYSHDLKVGVSFIIFLGFIIALSLVFIPMSIINKYYYGDYKINKIWIGSDNELCNNCLFIEFYKGCNQYQTFYFENEHTYSKGLKQGDIVDVRLL